jgi:hypothetical protein
VASELAQHQVNLLETSIDEGRIGALRARRRLSEARNKAIREREFTIQSIT